MQNIHKSTSAIWGFDFLMINVVYPCHAERLALIREQRAEAAKKREEEKAGKV